MSIENAIFWIEVDKIVPNPFQPRREFDVDRLRELSDSIKTYGVLQPLVVSRREDFLDNGSVSVVYELIAGERRLRASRLAGLLSVPVVVRVGDDNRQKLELAIIENIQRQDLNSVERAESFQRLAEEFKLTWADIGRKVGKSREYVSNTVRILMLPRDILEALSKGQISEGHTRPLLMLSDRPAEQMTLFKEMIVRKMTVREAEGIARKVAYDKARKVSLMQKPEIADMEERITESLGTRVAIEPKERGGSITISYFSHEELLALSHLLRKVGEERTHKGMLESVDQSDVVGVVGMRNDALNALNTSVHEAMRQIMPEKAMAPTQSILFHGVPASQMSPSLPVDGVGQALFVSENNNPPTIDLTERESSQDNSHVLDDRSIEEQKVDEEDDSDMYRFTI